MRERELRAKYYKNAFVFSIDFKWRSPVFSRITRSEESNRQASQPTWNDDARRVEKRKNKTVCKTNEQRCFEMCRLTTYHEKHTQNTKKTQLKVKNYT